MRRTIEFAYRRRYLLPATDPRFLDVTPEEMLVDYWAHAHWDDPKLEHEIVDDDFEDELDAMEMAAMQSGGPQPPAAGDPDQWEAVDDTNWSA